MLISCVVHGSYCPPRRSAGRRRSALCPGGAAELRSAGGGAGDSLDAQRAVLESGDAWRRHRGVAALVDGGGWLVELVK
eukprot:Skav205289  [mRNA]  locus=scaffold1690:389768:390004:+ [translate_table: standard]